MPKRKIELPAQRRHFHMFDEDWEYLNSKFGPKGRHSYIGVAKAIRTIVHSRIKQLQEMQTMPESVVDEMERDGDL